MNDKPDCTASLILFAVALYVSLSIGLSWWMGVL